MTNKHDVSSPGIARPPDPQQRHEPLPGFQPKTCAVDPEAPARTQVRLDSPGYRRAGKERVAMPTLRGEFEL